MPQDDLVFYVKLFVKPDRVNEWRAPVTEVRRRTALMAQRSHQSTAAQRVAARRARRASRRRR
jgi:hypothetical protein